MSKEIFNPSAPQYRKVEDLPKEEKKNFANFEDGFVRKEAKEELSDAEKIVELANHFKKMGLDAKELLKTRTKSRMMNEVGQALKDGKTTMDILHERAVAEELEPMDILQEEASEIHIKKYPEIIYLEKLRNNPNELNGFPGSIWGNKKFALEAVKLNRKALGKIYGRYNLSGDDYIEVALEAVKHDGLALQYAGDKLRANKDIVLEAVKQEPNAIKFASRDIKEAIRKVLKI